MCGVAGLFSYAAGPVEEATLVAMTDAMTHRGPDGSGHWLSGDRRIGLGHRRLAIVDLTDGGAQPMSDADASVHISFNGEIYNHRALRRQLEEGGVRFRSDHADTEVVVHGYKVWGLAGLLDRLEGMFAFALWDVREKRLHLVRDRIGIKPLYYTVADGRIGFASEIKGLVAAGIVTPDIDPMALYHYLTFLTTPAPMTMFAGVMKLAAATCLTIANDGAITAERYWTPTPGRGIDPAAVAGMNEGDREAFYVKGIADRLDEAVEKRMMADVPFGAFLSGGVDSSAITALMNRHSDRPVKTFSVGYALNEEFNELTEARRAASLLGTDHHEIVIDENDMTGYLDELVHSQDEPLADWVSVPLHFVSRLTRDAGVKVALVGEGADELFCGYEGFLAYVNAGRRLWPLLQSLPKPVAKGIAALLGVGANLHRKVESVADVMHRAAYDRELFWGGAIAFRDRRKRSVTVANGFTPAPLEETIRAAGLLPPGYDRADTFNVIEHLYAACDAARPGADLLTRMTWLELSLRLPELLLMRVDKVTMATSLEARVPFLDHRLVEFAMDIPGDAKVVGQVTKRLLKRAVADILPTEIIDRKKMAFGAPVSRWLRGSFGVETEAAILASPLMKRGLLDPAGITALFARHRSEKDDHAVQIWTIFNLTTWYDAWVG